MLERASDRSRLRTSVNTQRASDGLATTGARALRSWVVGVDLSCAMAPTSPARINCEEQIDNEIGLRQNLYGHGTHVASVATGGASFRTGVESTGVAPGAWVYDVKVLDGTGQSQLADALAGIDWVLFHARQYNTRVLNPRLAVNSAETFVTDPLCRAVRAATAAGITVVVAGGNFGNNASGAETFGTISSPGNDPIVITVGAANMKTTMARADDVVSGFSLRGPTRGSFVDTMGVRRVDNLIKPDLVAPGNRVPGAAATLCTTLDALAVNNPPLVAGLGGIAQPTNQALKYLSGTSVTAPVVSGTVALTLHANPGQTPPLIKVILQYSAQPSAGSIGPGSTLLATGKSLPASQQSTHHGVATPWGRVVLAGGSGITMAECITLAESNTMVDSSALGEP